MLTLDVPETGTTAAMLISLNIQPGPLLFQRSPDPVRDLVAALYPARRDRREAA
ncbi:tripartite tricarboxylate transporter permease [Paracoccus homiensis]|uniref:tripartite tricarboxylate transporter permease n=1 Tax=Paracoccus homiensis TaxID=364199 RepID=UPI00158707DE|nr:tripartite tricarboxylate transporter permease [Paracoccus homiensis]